MKKIIVLVFSIVALINFAPTFSQLVYAAEDPFERVCDRSNPNPDSTVCSTPLDKDPIKGADGIVAIVSNFVAALGGLIAVIMLIYNGLQFIMSSGDSNKLSQAKLGIIYAAVGIVVIIMARTIVYFVQSNL